MLRILSVGKCAVSEREICLQVEKNEISLRGERADLWRQVASNFKCLAIKHVMSGTRSCPRFRCNRRNGIQLRPNTGYSN